MSIREIADRRMSAANRSAVVQIDRRRRNFADKKAFVWAIFDACHAGGLRRSVLGNSGERFADTVLPSRVREKIRQKVAQRRAKIKKDGIVQHWVAKSKAGVVVFAAGTSSVKAQERPFVEEIFEDGSHGFQR